MITLVANCKAYAVSCGWDPRGAEWHANKYKRSPPLAVFVISSKDWWSGRGTSAGPSSTWQAYRLEALDLLPKTNPAVVCCTDEGSVLVIGPAQ